MARLPVASPQVGPVHICQSLVTSEVMPCTTRQLCPEDCMGQAWLLHGDVVSCPGLCAASAKASSCGPDHADTGAGAAGDDSVSKLATVSRDVRQ